MSYGNKLHRDSYFLNPLLNGQRGCVCLLMNAFSEVRNYPLWLKYMRTMWGNRNLGSWIPESTWNLQTLRRQMRLPHLLIGVEVP